MNLSHSELFRSIKSSNPSLYVELSNVVQWKTMLTAMVTTKASEILFRFEPEEVVIYASINSANALVSVWTKDMFTDYQVSNDQGIQFFAVTNKDLKSLLKKIQKDDVLVMSSCYVGHDTAFHNTIVTVIPDAPPIIYNMPMAFERADEEALPDLSILHMGEWNVTLSSKLFTQLIDKVTPAADYVQMSIKPTTLELSAFEVKEKKSTVHIETKSNQSFEGYFDDCQLIAITKCSSLNENLILKWVPRPGSECFIATYDICTGQMINKQSHLSFIIGLKSLE